MIERELWEMMLPIPTHLKTLFHPQGEGNHEFYVAGNIICSCGEEHFEIYYVGDVINNIVVVCTHAGYHYLTIAVKCSKCGKLHLIFDENQHGWNGFVCRETDVPVYEPFQLWRCPKCEGNIHKLSVHLHSEGKNDFIEEIGFETEGEGVVTEEDWVNGFSWITISTQCTHCQFEDPKWIDYETM
ncbi:hypothetical protein P4S95_04840 [Aneurinibacillus aneurinilyticus]|uniref:hypothetical protein n=1 Tax=Aneurinibacillus aneurinilyticus TaxID=1391 RepID=UPI002E242CD9|nr:hypothetical protein [Aneurinibacillus aneurinilyticus]